MTHEFEQLIDAIKQSGVIPKDAKVYALEATPNGSFVALPIGVTCSNARIPDPDGAIEAIRSDLEKYWAERGEAIAEHYNLTLKQAESLLADHCINFGTLLGARVLGVPAEFTGLVVKSIKRNFMSLCRNLIAP